MFFSRDKAAGTGEISVPTVIIAITPKPNATASAPSARPTVVSAIPLPVLTTPRRKLPMPFTASFFKMEKVFLLPDDEYCVVVFSSLSAICHALSSEDKLSHRFPPILLIASILLIKFNSRYYTGYNN